MADRRKLLIATVAATVAATWPASAGPAEIAGTVTLAGGGAVPAGVVVVYAEDPAARQRLAETRIASEGRARSIPFALPVPATMPPGLRAVARLERANGWLVARASAPIAVDAPLRLVLAIVAY